MAIAAAYLLLTEEWNTIPVLKLIGTGCGVHWTLSTREDGAIAVSTCIRMLLWLTKHLRVNICKNETKSANRGKNVKTLNCSLVVHIGFLIAPWFICQIIWFLAQKWRESFSEPDTIESNSKLAILKRTTCLKYETRRVQVQVYYCTLFTENLT